MTKAMRMLKDGRHPLGPDLHPDAAPIADRDADGRRCGNCRFRQTTDGRPKCVWSGEQQKWHLDANAWWPGCRDHQWEEDNVIGVRIADVTIGERARKDLGDLGDLMKSITELTLLQPIVVTRDHELIAGQRRLEACKRLGWEAIPAVVAEDITDAVDRLKAERDENTCRKDMTASELIELGKVIQTMERPKAASAQGHGLTAPGRPRNAFVRTNESVEKFDSRAKAAEAVGMSTATYSRLKQVHDAASDLDLPDPERARAQTTMSLIDRITNGEDVRDEQGHKLSVTRAYELWRGKPTGKRTTPSVEPPPASTGPPPATATTKPAARPRSKNRTNVVATVGSLLAKAEDAAELAGRITAVHMATRTEEAAVWSRRLSEALEPLQRLLDTFQEASQ